jgi:hypothetical protein
LIDLIFKCDFSIGDKFDLINYIAGKNILSDRLRIAQEMAEWLAKAPEQAKVAATIKGWQDSLVKLLVIKLDGEMGDELKQRYFING